MKPLDGVKVITLEHAIAAPFCTRQFADPGARVIKIERPGVGDFARAYDAPRRDWVCRMKRCMRSIPAAACGRRSRDDLAVWPLPRRRCKDGHAGTAKRA